MDPKPIPGSRMKCPKCGKLYRVPPQHSEKRVRSLCKNCNCECDFVDDSVASDSKVNVETQDTPIANRIERSDKPEMPLMNMTSEVLKKNGPKRATANQEREKGQPRTMPMKWVTVVMIIGFGVGVLAGGSGLYALKRISGTVESSRTNDWAAVDGEGTGLRSVDKSEPRGAETKAKQNAEKTDQGQKKEPAKKGDQKGKPMTTALACGFPDIVGLFQTIINAQNAGLRMKLRQQQRMANSS
jgi:hypothetical protein